MKKENIKKTREKAHGGGKGKKIIKEGRNI